MATLGMVDRSGLEPRADGCRPRPERGSRVEFRGRPTRAHLGYSVGSAGDVNGDGYSDLLVGAPDADNGESDDGSAYLFLGSAAGLALSPAWTLEGDQSARSSASASRRPVTSTGTVTPTCW